MVSKGHKVYWLERLTISIEQNVCIEPDLSDATMTVRIQSEGEDASDDVLDAPV